ncbi:hypothetical protein D9613_000023 [Agrocybe pediades]|uniref:Uncharacterized protein n=1 Tax=Agrocybe pediades TaxID=84607 RepID=A0A8H4R071_9AGAR|nr:hypothetical protein D9613_000023 [Agrocybe pediades]
MDPTLEHVERISGLLEAVDKELNDDPTLKEGGVFSEAQEQLGEAIILSKRLRSMAKPTASKKRWNVAAVSFSKVKASDYQRLGLTEMKACKIPSAAVFKTREMTIKLSGYSIGSIESITEIFLKSPSSYHMRCVLVNIGMSCGSVPESTSRMIIDQLLLSILIFMKNKHRIQLLMFTELWIAKQSNSIAIYHDTYYATLVTGLVDYAVAVKAGSASEELSPQTLEAETLDEVTQKLLLDALEKADQRSVQCEFTWVEAKRRNLAEELVKSVPQVATQALAVKAKTGIKCVPWCLTTGRRWIFGVVYSPRKQIENEHGEKNDTFILMLEPVDVEIKDTEDPMKNALREVLPLLLAWVLCSTEDIMDTFFKDLKRKIDSGELPTDPAVEKVTKKFADVQIK